jgi:putative ABC transport system ATP-binding protein
MGQLPVFLDKVCLFKSDGSNPAVTILNNISMSAHAGQITAIIGPSGCGKSSLIRLINRMSDPSAGEIYLFGTRISQLDPIELRRRVAMVLQKPHMFEGDVHSNLNRSLIYSNLPPLSINDSNLARVIELARISPALLTRDARSLSLGEQQRINIARAQITNPDVLLLDEPTSSLDRPTADALSITVRDICKVSKQAVILVTHDLRLAEKVADYIYFLDSGSIREEGLPAELLHKPVCSELIKFLEDPHLLEK